MCYFKIIRNKAVKTLLTGIIIIKNNNFKDAWAFV